MDRFQIIHELALLYVSKCEFDTPEELAKAYLEAKKAIKSNLPFNFYLFHLGSPSSSLSLLVF